MSYNKKGIRIPPIVLPAFGPAGVLKSTMNDMLLYLEHQMGLRDSPLKEEIELSHQVHASIGAKKMDMGLGWIIEKKDWSGSPIIHHDGKTIGYQTYCGFIEVKQIGVVINSTIQLKIGRILKIVMGLEGFLHEDIARGIFKKYMFRTDN